MSADDLLAEARRAAVRVLEAEGKLRAELEKLRTLKIPHEKGCPRKRRQDKRTVCTCGADNKRAEINRAIVECAGVLEDGYGRDYKVTYDTGKEP